MGHGLIATFDWTIDQLTFVELLLQIEDKCSNRKSSPLTTGCSCSAEHEW
jgi:hypothetical protein